MKPRSILTYVITTPVDGDEGSILLCTHCRKQLRKEHGAKAKIPCPVNGDHGDVLDLGREGDDSEHEGDICYLCGFPDPSICARVDHEGNEVGTAEYTNAREDLW